ncbi:hypothetical protein NTE_01700 [Candidatus Nitrososphaera evergladensis SR1]|uniref:Uncharacterized protein n=1 Tax=Candidatus Nitrososphaera evergladensis SR1 TaxID=1459636 RepID=A0A075MQF3_9ARCH|nr:hypothetical protein NTE_01700 [Candidatus Nitrososphaera evergladensis SR1]
MICIAMKRISLIDQNHKIFKDVRQILYPPILDNNNDVVDAESRIKAAIEELESAKRPELGGIYNEHIDRRIKLLQNFPKDLNLIENESQKLTNELIENGRKNLSDPAISLERIGLWERLGDLEFLKSILDSPNN